MIHFSRAATASVIVAALALSGCAAKESTEADTKSGAQSATTAGTQAGGSAPITVDATDTACSLSATESGTGKRSFVVTNNGTKVTEFYVYGPKDDVVAEVENVSPGLKRTLDVDFTAPGTYRTACKPGMVGDGISAEFTVTG